MYHSFRRGLIVVLAGGLMAACAAPVMAQDAAATFKSKCAMCHGADGKGGKMGTKDFASPEVQKQSDAELAAAIANGKGKMPKYGDKLKENEISELVTYIRGLAKK